MKVYWLIMVLVSFAIGIVVGMWYQSASQSYRSEEIIAKEISLLERYKNTPNCDLVMDEKEGWGRTLFDDGVIVWRWDKDQDKFEKVIVDKYMTAAYEQIMSYCSK